MNRLSIKSIAAQHDLHGQALLAWISLQDIGKGYQKAFYVTLSHLCRKSGIRERKLVRTYVLQLHHRGVITLHQCYGRDVSELYQISLSTQQAVSQEVHR